MKEILNIAEMAAREAGALLKDNFGKNIVVQQKKDMSLVTDIDKKSEAIIVEIIHSHWPDHSIIGEESGGSFDHSSDFTWVIDPIDGTHNFIRGMKLFGVSIGILKKKEFVGGVIYLPCDDVLYAAEYGAGAFKNGNRIRVSEYAKPEECTLVYDSGFKQLVDEKTRALAAVAPEMFNVRMFGASVRNLTYLAEGIADVVIEFDDNLWDYAAGVVIVTEAGGKVTNHNGGKLHPDDRKYVASNGFVHDAMLKLLP